MELKHIFADHADAVEERLTAIGVNLAEAKARLDDVGSGLITTM